MQLTRAMIGLMPQIADGLQRVAQATNQIVTSAEDLVVTTARPVVDVLDQGVSQIQRRFASVPLHLESPRRKPKEQGQASGPGASKSSRVRQADEIIDSLTGDPSRNDIAYVNALFERLASFNKPDTIMVVSSAKSYTCFNFHDFKSNRHNLFDYFINQVLEIPLDQVPPRMSKNLVNSQKARVPNHEMAIFFELHRMLNTVFHQEIFVSTGDGRTMALNFDTPENMDPMDVFRRLVESADDMSMSKQEDVDEDQNNKPSFRMITVDDREYSISEIVGSFEGLFFARDDLNHVLQSVGLRKLVRHKDDDLLQMIRDEKITFPNGALLYGPGGTGKSELMNAIGHAYAKAGALVAEFSIGAMGDKYVFSLANNLTKAFDEILEINAGNKLPALIIIDEASSVATEVESSQNTARYYQEALDEIKNYATKHPDIVIVMATNAKAKTLDGPLTRSKRLEPIHIGPPKEPEQMKMMAYFLKKHGVMDDLTEEETARLIKHMPDATGADLSSFAEKFGEMLVSEHYRGQGLETDLDVLAHFEKTGDILDFEDVRDSITFEQILQRFQVFAQRRRQQSGRTAQLGFGKRS